MGLKSDAYLTLNFLVSDMNKRLLELSHSANLPLQKTNRNFLPSSSRGARFEANALAARRVYSTPTRWQVSASLNWSTRPPIALVFELHIS
jgi:hypothetical protein